MTLSQLALTIALLGGLGLVAGRFGLSAIPAYLLAGLLLGPHEPHVTSLIEPSEVTTFVAELGIIFLLFFLGLEFTVDRLLRSARHIGLGGSIDLAVNAAVGLLVGVIAFGFGFPALILAAAIYVSSSAVTVKGLIDFRRLADDETDLILAILVFEDIVIAGVLGFAAAGGAGREPDARRRREGARLRHRLDRRVPLRAPPNRRACSAACPASSCSSPPSASSSAWRRSPRSSASPRRSARSWPASSWRRLRSGRRSRSASSPSGTSSRRSSSSSSGSRSTWARSAASAGSSPLAVVLTVLAKIAGGYGAGVVGGFSPRQSLNVGAALVAHGEFTIILAQIASDNDAISSGDRSDFVAFAGLYVLATATLGIILMKESKRIGRRLFPPRLA